MALKTHINKVVCHEMRIIDAFGMSRRFTYREFFDIVCSRLTISFALLVAIALFGADPHGFRDIMPLYASFAIWILGVLSFLVFKLAMFSLWSTVSIFWPRVPYYMPISTTVEYGGVAILMDRLARTVAAPGTDPEILSNYPYYLLTIWLIELGFVRFGVPFLIGEVPTTSNKNKLDGAGKGTGSKGIQIGNRTLDMASLLYMRSEEHYLNVTTTRDRFTERATLASLLPNLEPLNGIQPHRSWWVSPECNPRYKRIDGKPTLVLHDNTKVPVARGRLAETKAWLETITRGGNGG